MYTVYCGKKSINMWLKSKPVTKTVTKKHQSSNVDDIPPAKRSRTEVRTEAHMEKMDKLQQICKELKEKHNEGQYSHLSDAQFHCWGNSIQLGSHKSYEHPPNKPYFGCTRTAASTTSPGKRIKLRSECIDQLTKWHQLMENGVISSQEYEDMHKTILRDIKKY